MIFLKVFISFLASVICLFLATRNVHWQELKTILSEARVIPVVLGMLISLVTFFLRALRWQILLQPFQKIATFTLLRLQIGGLLINNLLPLRMGELARAYWTGHKTAISRSTILATIFLERILDVSSIAFLAVLLLFAMGFYQLNTLLNFRNAAIFFSVILTLCLSIRWIKERLGKNLVSQKLKNHLPETMLGALENFLSGLKIVQNKTEIIKLSSLSLLIWCVDITILLIFSRSLSFNLTWRQSGLTMVGLILGALIPAPGGVTTYEGGGVAALTFLGIKKSLALSFMLLLHAAQLFWVTLLGIPVLLMEGFSPKKLLKNSSGNSG